MEPNFTNYAGNQIINKYSSQSIKEINSNINVVINSQSKLQNSNININNNILVIQNFNKDSNNNNDDIKKESPPRSEAQSQQSPQKRIDRKGNEIKQSGKHCVVFIDKISKMRFADVVEIESYKEFNQSEYIPSSNSQKNSCCRII